MFKKGIGNENKNLTEILLYREIGSFSNAQSRKTLDNQIGMCYNMFNNSERSEFWGGLDYGCFYFVLGTSIIGNVFT